MCRLGPGAFLLTLVPQKADNHEGGESNTTTDTGSNGCCRDDMGTKSEDGVAQREEKRGPKKTMKPVSDEDSYRLPLGPHTRVCTVGDRLAWRCEGIEESTSLGILLRALGITQVVYVVTSTTTDQRPDCAMMHDEGSNIGIMGRQEHRNEGYQSTHVLVHSCADAESNDVLSSNSNSHSEDYRSSYLPVSSGSHNAKDSVSDSQSHGRVGFSADGVVSDVMAFATGSRVLFVGRQESGKNREEAAGAIAMAWSMARTGKGILETMLDFRQSCNGFWVDPALLKSVLG